MRGLSVGLVSLLSLASACGDDGSASDGDDAGHDEAGAARDAGPDATSVADAGLDAAVPPDLPTCDVLAAFDPGALEAPEAGSGGYAVPDGATLADAEALVRAVAAGRLAEAMPLAEGIGYELCRGEGDQEDLRLLRPLPPTGGRARLAIRAGDARPLVLEVPHPLFDSRTLEESLGLFTSLGARALLVSGTHRCANTAASGCDGTTSACGASAPYPESDVAHATDTIFHRAHVALADVLFAELFLSVHGMAGDGVSLSDGTTGDVDTDTPVAQIAQALDAAGFENVTACNPGAGVPQDERLCGTTNVQGRHLNGAADACSDAADTASKRFVHMEQSRAVRDRPELVGAALATATAR